MTDTALFEALPVAVYTTDAEGRITYYNQAAAELWGHRPELGSARWCGSWRLYWPDGQPLPFDECPMAIALKEGREVRGVEAIAERPDGTRVPFMPYPTPLKDGSGRVTGAINLLVDVTEQKRAQIDSALLSAIVASSDDAIISKTLTGLVTSWNAGASRIFGYTAEEMIGQPITRIIPPDLQEEEDTILAKLRRGERVDHFDTVRCTKDGRRIDISLTVSPLRDQSGRVVGASKVARDVTERKRSEELQRLLLDELNHRVKNTLATIQAIASQSLLRAASPVDFVASFNGRVQALARAHDLLVCGEMKGAEMTEIVREQVALGASDLNRIFCSGPAVTLDAKAAVQLALVLHELATNARKYGALSVPTGQLSITWDTHTSTETELFITWRETGVPKIRVPTSHGFGTTLIERTLAAHDGDAAIRYGADGIVCEIRLPLPKQAHRGWTLPAERARDESAGPAAGKDSLELHGKRVLLIEDEALVAMEIEAQLRAEGCQVVGPAGTVQRAMALIEEADLDAVLLDANLGGHPVHELAAALIEKGIPFAFATGYGREGLPEDFRQAAVLAKPFGQDQLSAVLRSILIPDAGSAEVISIHRRRS